MRNFKVLTMALAALALSLSVACSGDDSANPPETTEVAGTPAQQKPGNAPVSAPRTEVPASQITKTKAPVVVIFKKDGDDEYERVRPVVEEMRRRYESRLRFYELDVSPAGLKKSAEDAQKIGISGFFATNKTVPALVGIFSDNGNKRDFLNEVDFKSDPNQKYDINAYAPRFEAAAQLADQYAGGGGGGGDAGGEKVLDESGREVTLASLHERVRAAEGKVAANASSPTTEAFDDFKTNSMLGMAVLGSLALLGLGLSAVNLYFITRLEKRATKNENDLRRVAKVAQTATAVSPPASFPAAAVAGAAGKDASSANVSSALDGVSQQMQQQKQSLDLLTNRIGQLENRASAGEQKTVESLQAVEQVTKWLERMHMRGAEVDGFADESDPASNVPALERDLERLRANANSAEPLSQAVADLVERLEARPSASPELLNRVQKLYHDIGQFDQWALAVETHLGALRRGSIDERRVEFKNQQRQLTQQFHSKQINFAQYIEQFSRMLEQHFPAGSGNGRAAQAPPAPRREQFARYAEGAPEYLMDWFSNFSQLQSQAQAAQATGAGVDSETLTELARVQSVAREVLNRFDIQPEEIMVGRTSYDRHLHDAAMVRQSTQFPTNTIIEVHSAGFRRVSTGEVLRRPQVIVAGSAV